MVLSVSPDAVHLPGCVCSVLSAAPVDSLFWRDSVGVLSGSSKEPSRALGKRKGSQGRLRPGQRKPHPEALFRSEAPKKGHPNCPVAAEPQAPGAGTFGRVCNGFLTITLRRMVRASTVRLESDSPGSGPSLHGSRGFITRPPPSLVDFRL